MRRKADSSSRRPATGTLRPPACFGISIGVRPSSYQTRLSFGADESFSVIYGDLAGKKKGEKKEEKPKDGEEKKEDDEKKKHE